MYFILGTYRDALICDLAETYRIYDYHSVPALTLAILVDGLTENSRVGRLRDGRKVSLEALLLANLCDLVDALAHGLVGKNPESNIAQSLLIKTESDKGMTPEEFDMMRKRIMKER